MQQKLSFMTEQLAVANLVVAGVVADIALAVYCAASVLQNYSTRDGARRRQLAGAGAIIPAAARGARVSTPARGGGGGTLKL